MNNKSNAVTEQDRIDFSYKVIGNLMNILGVDVSAEELFTYLIDFDKFKELALSSNFAVLHMIVEQGKEHFEEMIVLPVPNDSPS
ncbi:hypothetical protein [Thalassotalea crassostreae]|uniref:hypothetical protein n=1 Tax=Thalassotalea crassostreae TaxID=1763536 RepID=UPI000838FA9D|nr:hypothetical protein [Thalassotalea crassostreae]